MNNVRRIVACFTAAVFLLSINIQPSVAISGDFQIKGGMSIYMDTGSDYQLDYVTGGDPHEFISSHPHIVSVDQNGLLHSSGSGNVLILLRSLVNSNVGAAVNVIVSASTGPTKYAVSYRPGTEGTFSMQVNNGLIYGNPTPSFIGIPIGNPGYMFTGWSPAQTDTVTGTTTYVAQWGPEQPQVSSFSSALEVDAVLGDTYQVAVSAIFLSDYSGRQISITYDNTVFNVTAMGNHTNLTFLQISPGAIRFEIDLTVTEGAINLLSLGALKTESSHVKMFSY